MVVTLPGLEQCASVDNFARILNRYLEDITLVQKFILRVQIPGNEDEAENVYQRFLQFKALCDHSTKLSLILEFEANLPSDDLIYRFWSEPVFAIELDTRVFIRNAKNFPVLSKRHQQVLKEFMKCQAAVIFKPRHINAKTIDYHQYVTEYLFKNHDSLDHEEQQEVPFRNYI